MSWWDIFEDVAPWAPFVGEVVNAYTDQSNARRQQTRDRVEQDLIEGYNADQLKLYNEALEFRNMQEANIEEEFQGNLGPALAMMTSLPDTSAMANEMTEAAAAGFDAQPMGQGGTQAYADALGAMRGEVGARQASLNPLRAAAHAPFIENLNRQSAQALINSMQDIKTGTNEIARLVGRDRPVSQTPHELAKLYEGKFEELGPMRHNPFTGLGSLFKAGGQGYYNNQMLNALKGIS
jgi:hypothetical protein